MIMVLIPVIIIVGANILLLPFAISASNVTAEYNECFKLIDEGQMTECPVVFNSYLDCLRVIFYTKQIYAI